MFFRAFAIAVPLLPLCMMIRRIAHTVTMLQRKSLGKPPIDTGTLHHGVFRVESGIMEMADITCPTCCESFCVAVPSDDEMPCEVDYDCEVCCRPLLVVFTREGVWAKGLGD